MALFVRSFILVALLCSSVANARDAVQQELLIDTTFLSPAQMLPAPPASDTFATQSEIDEVKGLIATASAEQRTLAASDALDKTAGFFADVIPGFKLDGLPKTRILFEQVRYSENHQAKVFKNYFKRPRPYVTDPSIVPCVPAEKGGELQSYPSGHATMAFSMGVVLAHLMPERAAPIMQRARLYAANRIRCGAHHRSDIVAGQVLGTVVAIELMQNLTFQKIFAESHSELQAARLAR